MFSNPNVSNFMFNCLWLDLYNYFWWLSGLILFAFLLTLGFHGVDWLRPPTPGFGVFSMSFLFNSCFGNVCPHLYAPYTWQMERKNVTNLSKTVGNWENMYIIMSPIGYTIWATVSIIGLIAACALARGFHKTLLRAKASAVHWTSRSIL